MQLRWREHGVIHVLTVDCVGGISASESPIALSASQNASKSRSQQSPFKGINELIWPS